MIKVERRVVNKLAAAQESDAVSEGAVVTVATDYDASNRDHDERRANANIELRVNQPSDTGKFLNKFINEALS